MPYGSDIMCTSVLLLAQGPGLGIHAALQHVCICSAACSDQNKRCYSLQLDWIGPLTYISSYVCVC